MQLGNITLRPYQERDVKRFLEEQSCLIAYDRRGGKSIAALAIATHLMERHSGAVLIISDATSPWIRDLEKIGIPSDRLHLVDRPKREKFKTLLENIQPGHFYQIHWAGLCPEIKLLLQTRWVALIADEAHAAKNRNAQRTRALKRLRTHYKIALTADPDDNAPQDIWSLLNWIRPKQYRSYWRWVREYVEVEELESERGTYFSYGRPLNVEKFQAEIKPFFVSMTLEEIDPGQVPIQYESRVVDMHPEQAKAYRDMLTYQMTLLGDDLVMAEWPMVWAMRLQQLAQAMGRPEFKQVWKTYYERDPETGKLVRKRKQVETVKVHQVEPSSKLDDMILVLTDQDRPPGPTVIFSQFPGMIKLAGKRLDDAGIKHVMVLKNHQVNEAMRQFQSGEVDLIIGTTAHLSQSIELSRADTMGFLDCPWNPRVRSQTEGRPKAVGKRTPIRCIDWRTRNTVDFARLDRVRTKQEWKDALLGRKYTIHELNENGACDDNSR